jgi:17 kDa outer membrane surface antigen
MYGRAHSYIGDGRRRQMRLVRPAAIAVLALSLGGCAGLGLPFGEAGTAGRLAAANGPVQPILASAVVSSQADPSDWDTIRRTIEGAPTAASRLDWNNAITGSTGSVAIAADKGETCRAFASTINDLRGIRRYRGQACIVDGGRSQLRAIVADDVTL